MYLDNSTLSLIMFNYFNHLGNLSKMSDLSIMEQEEAVDCNLLWV